MRAPSVPSSPGGAPSTAQAHAACTALYSNPDPAQRTAANAWLMQFAATDAAWSAAFELMATSGGGASEIRFWAANMLYSKVQKDWRSAAVATQERVYAQLLAMSLDASGETLELLSLLVVERLCLCLATIASATSPEALVALLQRCLAVGAARPLVVLSVIEPLPRAIADSVFTMAEQQRLGGSLDAAAPSVASFLEFALGVRPATTTSGGSSSVVAVSLAQKRLVMRTLGAWADGERRDVAPPITLGTLAGRHELLRHALQALTEPSSDVAQLSADALCALIAKAGDADVELLAAIASTCVATYGACVAAPAQFSSDSPAWMALALVISALCEYHPHIVSRGGEPFLSVVQVLLRCTSHAELSVGSITFEAWLGLQDIPLVERHATLQREVWVRLVGIVATQCRLDADATDVVPDADGEESAFREGPPGCTDVLVSTFDLLRGGILEPLIPVFTPARCVAVATVGDDSWRSVEAAHFVIHAISRGLVQFACNQAAGKPDLAERKQCSEILQRLVGMMHEGMKLVQRGQVTAHPVLIASSARLFGSLATWVAHPQVAGGAMLNLALEFVVWVLQTGSPTARGHAAKALQKLCKAGRRRLGNAEALAQLSNALDSAVTMGISTEDCAAIANGIGTILSQIGRKADTPAILLQLCTPPIARIRSALELGRAAASPGARASAAPLDVSELIRVTCASLKLVRELVRFADAAAVESALHAVWPTLDAAARAWSSEVRVMEEVCVLYSTLCASMRPPATGLLPRLDAIVNVLVASFAMHRLPSSLESIAVAIEHFGAAASPEIWAGLLEQLVDAHIVAPQQQRARGGLSPGGSIALKEPSPATHAAFFQLCQRFVMFCPRGIALLKPDTLLTLCNAAYGVVTHAERDPARAAAQFVSVVVKRRHAVSATVPLIHPHFDTCFAEKGAGRTAVRLAITCAATCSDATEGIIPHLAAVLWCLRAVYSAQIQEWLFAALSEQSFGLVEGEDAFKTRVLQLLLTCVLFVCWGLFPWEFKMIACSSLYSSSFLFLPSILHTHTHTHTHTQS